MYLQCSCRFLSTLSLRRATPPTIFEFIILQNFYPRSPCGERPYGRINDISRLIFLSTLSLRRATYVLPVPRPPQINFYPRSPCGERHLQRLLCEANSYISIHALLAESDMSPGGFWAKITNFYPRSPCGERRLLDWDAIGYTPFLSTLSLRRATRS